MEQHGDDDIRGGVPSRPFVNDMSGQANVVFQTGTMHVGRRSGPPGWVLPAALAAAAALVAGGIVAYKLMSGPDLPPYSLGVHPQTSRLPFYLAFPTGSVAGLPAPVDDQCLTPYEHGEPEERGAQGVVFTIAAHEHPVRVNDVDLEVERVEGTPEHDAIACQGQVGGPMSTSVLFLDLDRRAKKYVYPADGDTLVSTDGFPRDAGQPGVPLALDVPARTVERVHVRADSRNCHCRWRLVLRLEVAGRELDAVVDDGGEPFELLPEAGPYAAHSYDPAAGRWTRG
ncbi:hypothetical protein Q5530_14095 [Saccharothrix sp. BKS2]|uniref:hypothetical protein n=1 Tax=Saccharothrix sp. BKS2 TaxID=3064400 RepID=UPI0039ECEC17